MVSRPQQGTPEALPDTRQHVDPESTVEATGGRAVLNHTGAWSTVELFDTPRARKAAPPPDTAIAGPRPLGDESVGAAPDGPRPGVAATAGEAADAAVRGRLDSVTVADVVQWLCLMTKTGILTVDSPNCQTSIFIEHGSVIHAQNGSCRARQALLQALWLQEGSFAFVERHLECERSIVEHIESLVLQAAFDADKAAHPEEPTAA